jgi:hypothetical protein
MLILIFRWLILVQSDCAHLQWRLCVTDGVVKLREVQEILLWLFWFTLSIFGQLPSCLLRLDKAQQNRR